MEWKVFNDIVHGHMQFHPLIVSIIDTPQFQRLRYIKQVGPCYFIFPSALHTRFEHSLGTAFLAGKLMDAMNRKRGFFGEEAEKETLSIQIAGLCHDLGHGPFSHTWERFLKRCGKEWNHEKFSVSIFNQILDEFVPDKSNGGQDIKIRELFKRYGVENFIDKIKHMITGVKDKPENSIRQKYLYQVIANKTNGIDVDKWEYLMRDSKMTNIPSTFDCDRLIFFCKILKGKKGCEEICFRDKECSSLVNMFLMRGILHDKVYQHRKVKIIEEMLIDAFFLANTTLNFATLDINSFLKLTDHIYQKILYDDFGQNKDIEEAKKILRRLERRRLYVCIASYEYKGIITGEMIKKIEEMVFKKLRESNDKLERDFVKIIEISVNMTKYNKKENLKGVQVYRKRKLDEMLYESDDFSWNDLRSVKPDLKSLPRNELLVLYKGDEFSKYKERSCDNILVNILEKLEILNK